MDELLGPEMDGYQILLRELKARIRNALILLYWGIGCEILERTTSKGGLDPA